MTLLGRAAGAIGSRDVATDQEPIRGELGFASAANTGCARVAMNRRVARIGFMA